MKKKLSIIYGEHALAAALTGCTRGAQNPPADCAALGEAILQSQAFSPEMTVMSENRLYALLEMDEALAVDAFMALDASRTTAEAVVAVTAASGKEGDVAALLAAYRDSLLSQYRDYQPAEVPKLEAAQVMTRGAQSVLIIAPDQDRARSDCKAKWNP